MISIGQLEKRPSFIFDYYKNAIANPKEFCRSLNFNEEVADSGLSILAIAGLQALIVGFIGVGHFSIYTGILMSFFGFCFGVGLGSVIVFVVAKIAEAKMNFLNSFNLVIHSWILTLPLNLLTQLFFGLGFVTTIINLVFMIFVMINIFKAIAVRVYVITGILFLISFVPYACVKLSQSVLENNPSMQEVLQGRSLEQFAAEIKKQSEELRDEVKEEVGEDLEEAAEDIKQGKGDMAKAMAQLAQMQEGIDQAEKALPQCYHDEIGRHDDKNPVFQMAGSQISMTGVVPKAERKEHLQNVERFIDEAIRNSETGFKLSESQIQCLKEMKANLVNLK